MVEQTLTPEYKAINTDIKKTERAIQNIDSGKAQSNPQTRDILQQRLDRLYEARDNFEREGRAYYIPNTTVPAQTTTTQPQVTQEISTKAPVYGFSSANPYLNTNPNFQSFGGVASNSSPIPTPPKQIELSGEFFNDKNQGFSINPDLVPKNVNNVGYGFTNVEYYSGRKETVNTNAVDLYGTLRPADDSLFRKPVSSFDVGFGLFTQSFKNLPQTAGILFNLPQKGIETISEYTAIGYGRYTDFATKNVINPIRNSFELKPDTYGFEQGYGIAKLSVAAPGFIVPEVAAVEVASYLPSVFTKPLRNEQYNWWDVAGISGSLLFFGLESRALYLKNRLNPDVDYVFTGQKTLSERSVSRDKFVRYIDVNNENLVASKRIATKISVESYTAKDIIFKYDILQKGKTIGTRTVSFVDGKLSGTMDSYSIKNIFGKTEIITREISPIASKSNTLSFKFSNEVLKKNLFGKIVNKEFSSGIIDYPVNNFPRFSEKSLSPYDYANYLEKSGFITINREANIRSYGTTRGGKVPHININKDISFGVMKIDKSYILRYANKGEDISSLKNSLIPISKSSTLKHELIHASDYLKLGRFPKDSELRAFSSEKDLFMRFNVFTSDTPLTNYGNTKTSYLMINEGEKSSANIKNIFISTKVSDKGFYSFRTTESISQVLKLEKKYVVSIAREPAISYSLTKDFKVVLGEVVTTTKAKTGFGRNIYLDKFDIIPGQGIYEKKYPQIISNVKVETTFDVINVKGNMGLSDGIIRKPAKNINPLLSNQYFNTLEPANNFWLSVYKPSQVSVSEIFKTPLTKKVYNTENIRAPLYDSGRTFSSTLNLESVPLGLSSTKNVFVFGNINTNTKSVKNDVSLSTKNYQSINNKYIQQPANKSDLKKDLVPTNILDLKKELVPTNALDLKQSLVPANALDLKQSLTQKQTLTPLNAPILKLNFPGNKMPPIGIGGIFFPSSKNKKVSTKKKSMPSKFSGFNFKSGVYILPDLASVSFTEQKLFSKGSKNFEAVVPRATPQIKILANKAFKGYSSGFIPTEQMRKNKNFL